MNDKLITQLTQELLHYVPPESERGDKIHVSEIKECIRKTYYRLIKAQPDPDRIANYERAKFTMGYGELWELYICRLLDQLKIPWKKVHVEDKNLNLVGETDPVIKFQGKEIILEAKGVHQAQFEVLYDFAKKNVLAETYYSQLQGYLFLYPVADYGAFIIGNRNQNPKDKNPPFFLQEIHRDEDWFGINFKEPDGRIPKLNYHLDTNTLPDREFTKDSWPCRLCHYHNRCWE
jgi:hypothetical protein